MMSFLRPDSDFMNAVSTCADYVIVNLLCLLCCLPLVTAGAALTARYYVSMKMARGEEPAVTRAFFLAFRRNLRQATVVWGILACVLVLLGLDWYLILKKGAASFHPAYLTALALFTVLAAGAVFCVFPLLARFYISTGEALKGAVLFVLMKLPRVLLSLTVTALIYLAGLWYVEWFLLIWVVGTGAMLYYNSRMFVREFEKLEGLEQESREDGAEQEPPAGQDESLASEAERFPR